MSTLHSRATRGAALGALALFVFGTIAHADPADAGAGGPTEGTAAGSLHCQ